MRKWIGCACLGLILAGCGRSGQGLVPVQGQVFHRGKPLAGGTIVFTPDPQRGGRGPVAHAEIGADGRFRLRTSGKNGAVPGWHCVTVAPCADAGLPAHFRDPELSGLRAEVQPERANVCNFHLD
jgi:hypothetical protein